MPFTAKQTALIQISTCFQTWFYSIKCAKTGPAGEWYVKLSNAEIHKKSNKEKFYATGHAFFYSRHRLVTNKTGWNRRRARIKSFIWY